MTTNYTGAIKRLSKSDVILLIRWLKDDKEACAENDPASGIYPSQDLYDAFGELIEYVINRQGEAER